MTNFKDDSKDSINKTTKKDLNRVFWRSLTMEYSWNYERQAHIGFCYSIVPFLSKLYKGDEYKKALQRHMEFFNTTPHLSTLILGITAAMEEENAKNNSFDTASINGVKASLMGPLAGVGDSFFWGTLRLIATGVGTSLALKGNILGPILFLLIFNVPHFLLRYLSNIWGYKIGTDLLTKLETSGAMDNLTYGASVVGLMVIGAMAQSMIAIEIPLKLGSGEGALTITEILNEIAPGILPLAAFGIVYYAIKKGLKPVPILLAITAISIIGASMGIL
ncbi:PTS system mannose/fructose/sorbose family transporter subunit IID [Marinilactibacillus psychrotolerans]|uniref:PTS system mannose/fructose/sorbose family transporter subunit IID n=1 Tax=Marinilactibacillus psychrotolerans TaxID=191770 RepID=A0A5R9C2I1_9LACT|nr:PTS system mannose/fructose/sorbose family transporter subunit IID [Marinilactibacillus psychrotolerans]TLQ06944.1 PTS system mannose/fructose/sorbose family transporter subunit IID [Marinilactibacillus psychrotolerans]